MRKIISENGRSLLETLAVLVIIAIILLASVLGYDFVLHQWKKQQTVKQVSELFVRYELRPVKPEAGDVKVAIKTLYPEVDRADAVTMKTADAGTSYLITSSTTDSFAVVMERVLADSCETQLERGEYGGVLLSNGNVPDLNILSGQYQVLGKDVLQKYDDLTEAQKEEVNKVVGAQGKENVIKKICDGDDDGVTMGVVAMVGGGTCPPSMGGSYYYKGQCWQCPQDKSYRDKFGNCCHTPNKCGLCPEVSDCKEDSKTCKPDQTVCDPSNGRCVQCVSNDNCKCRTDGKNYCLNNKCVECTEVGKVCPGQENTICTEYHTCEKCEPAEYYHWVNKQCVCKKTLEVGAKCPGSCCKTGTFCHQFGEGADNKVCTECAYNYGEGPEGSASTESCPEDKPLCVSAGEGNKGKKCVSCPADKPVYSPITHTCVVCWNEQNGTSHGCPKEDKKGFTRCDESGNSGSGQCVCPSPLLMQNSSCEPNSNCCDSDKGLICEGITHKCQCSGGKFWNATAGKCTECLRNYDGTEGSGACETTENPLCDNTSTEGHVATWTCGPCQPGTTWDVSSKTCVEPHCTQEDYGNECAREGCCKEGLQCVIPDGAASGTCRCPTGKYWHANMRKCVSCLANYGSGETGACPTLDDPVCELNDNQTDLICNPCSNKEEYDVSSQECVCKASEFGYGASCTACCKEGLECQKAEGQESGTCQCPEGTHWDPETETCIECTGNGHCDGRNDGKIVCGSNHVCVCPANKFWNEEAGRCTDCLANYQSGREGACLTQEKPLCDRDQDWTCQPCDSEAPWWNTYTKNCVECLSNYQSGQNGACPTSASPLCDGQIEGGQASGTWTCEPCESGYKWDEQKHACVQENQIPPGTVIYQSGGMCCSINKSYCKTNCCGCDKEVKKTLKLNKGKYEVVVIGAAGGSIGNADGRGSTNYGSLAIGGSGASFKGILTVKEDAQPITAVLGDGGSSRWVTDKKDISGFDGDDSYVSTTGGKLINCPGGKGGYIKSKKSGSGGAGGAKCSIASRGNITVTTNQNNSGNDGNYDKCAHTSCDEYVPGVYPKFTMDKNNRNYGGSCSGVAAFKHSKASVPGGNCGYVRIIYKGPLN